eukprot:scaffold57144_cov66-Phaeocystis_antarctica.AAC.1
MLGRVKLLIQVLQFPRLLFGSLLGILPFVLPAAQVNREHRPQGQGDGPGSVVPSGCPVGLCRCLCPMPCDPAPGNTRRSA